MAKESADKGSGCGTIVFAILFLGFLLGGCMYVMDCAGGSMTGGPPASWCPF